MTYPVRVIAEVKDIGMHNTKDFNSKMLEVQTLCRTTTNFFLTWFMSYIVNELTTPLPTHGHQ